MIEYISIYIQLFMIIRIINSGMLILCLTMLTSCSGLFHKTISEKNQKRVLNNEFSIIIFKPRINYNVGNLYVKYNKATLFWQKMSLINSVPSNDFSNITDGGSRIRLNSSFLSYEDNEHLNNYDSSIVMVVNPGTYALSMIGIKYEHDPRVVGSGVKMNVEYVPVTKSKIVPSYDYYRYKHTSLHNSKMHYESKVYEATPTITTYTKLEPAIVGKTYRQYEYQTDYVYISLPPQLEFTILPGQVLYLGEINLYYDILGNLSYSVINYLDNAKENGKENFPMVIDRIQSYNYYVYNKLIDVPNIKVKDFTKTKIVDDY